MNVPSIGKTRGIFDIFVPGAFLLINLIGFLYLISFSLEFYGKYNNCIYYLVNNPALIIIILICFGYLIGMIIRLFMTDIPDNLSALYHRIFNKNAKIGHGKYRPWSREKFPYIESVGELIIRDLGDTNTSIYNFYSKVWNPRKREGGNKRFFNLCKIMLIREGNEMIVSELYASESINRYISGMFYSVLISILLILIIIPFQFNSEYIYILFFILFFYLIGLWNIIIRFRFIRLKEVQTLFDACYQNKEKFVDLEITE